MGRHKKVSWKDPPNDKPLYLLIGPQGRQVLRFLAAERDTTLQEALDDVLLERAQRLGLERHLGPVPRYSEGLTIDELAAMVQPRMDRTLFGLPREGPEDIREQWKLDTLKLKIREEKMFEQPFWKRGDDWEDNAGYLLPRWISRVLEKYIEAGLMRLVKVEKKVENAGV